MNFIFDGADFLVIMVIMIIYFVSRRFEKTGRSLEKVRRYADKSKSELDNIVREREMGLRDISVDIEVREKTNREILAQAEKVHLEIIKRLQQLEQGMERVEEQEKALENLNKLATSVDENLRRLKEESAYVDNVGSRLTEIRRQFTSIAAKDAERFNKMRQEFYREIQSELSNIKSGLSEYSSQIEIHNENLEHINSNNEKNTLEHIRNFETKLKELESNFHDRINRVADKAINLEDDMYMALNEKIQAHIQAMQSNSEKEISHLEKKINMSIDETEQSLTKAKADFELWEARHCESLEVTSEGFEQSLLDMEASRQEWQSQNDKTLRAHVEGFKGNIQKMNKGLQEWEKNMEERITKCKQDFDNQESRIQSVSDNLNRNMEKAVQHFDHTIQDKELEIMEKTEERQNSYKDILERKFAQIEDFIKDVDRTKDLLKSNQDSIVQDIEKQFTSFDMKMTQIRVEEKKRHEKSNSELEQDMLNLEKKLEELKARAYDNVSEKLQVFEDDFFKTLKDRDAEIESRLKEWQYDADTRLGDLAARTMREREEIEHRYSAEMERKLNEFQNRILSQFSGFEEQVDGFRDSLNNRMHISEALLGSFQSEMRTKISENRQTAFSEFNNSYEEFSSQVEEKFIKANKIIRQKLQSSADEIQKQHRVLIDEISSSRGDISDWQNRVNVQIEEVETNTAQVIQLMKNNLADTVQELNDEFASKAEQLTISSGESHSEIKRQIIDLEDILAKLTQNMNDKIQSSLDMLKDQSESFLLDFRKSSRDARDEMDRKVKELRQSVQESRERAENNRREMVANTDSEYTRLMRNIDDIDRRQREFIAETRLFERADEMKEILENDISKLKAQIDSVKSGREEVRHINEQYLRAITLHDEISNRFGRLEIEQNNIENLEARMIRINNLSDSVDLKLQQVNDANDILQGLNIRLKQLEKQHENLNDRYEHLNEKSSVLDATNDGVDNSFQLIYQIQNEIETISGNVAPLTKQIEQVKERQRRIEQDSQKVETVVGKIGSIDSTINELDKRVQDLLKAREWLARTESRLKEINEETHQNLRLLGTLSQRGAAGKTSGSPDMSTREIVVKLARQGWDSEEIARNTKLSQGEVELILELTPNNP